MRTVFTGGTVFDGTGASVAEADAGLRQAVEDGVLVGPRMQISVNMISMTGGHSDAWLPSGAVSQWGVTYPGMPSGVCDGGEGVRAKVREMVRAGADVINGRLERGLPLTVRRSEAPPLHPHGG